MQLNLTAPVELQAAADPEKPARASILAYSGGPMSVSGWGPVLIDLVGLKMSGSIPLLADHNSTIEGVAGSGTPRVDSGRLFVEGTLAGTPSGRRIRELAASGVPLQASVGVAPTDSQAIRPGEKVRANGREHTAGPSGLTLVRAGLLREVSITPLGADATTTVSIAAKRGQTMSIDTHGTPSDLPADPTQAERERVRAIMAACGPGHAEIQTQAIAAGWSLETTKAALYDRNQVDSDLAELRANRADRYLTAPNFHGGAPRPAGNTRDTLTAAAMILGGHGQAVVKHVPNGERLANTLDRPTGWPELCAMALRLEGQDVPRDRHEMVRAAFSTTSLPVAVGSGVQKVALQTFLESTSNVLAIARVVAATDFRGGKALRLAAASKFEQVGPTGELKHGDLAEDAFDFRIGTYGKMFGVDRQTLINDDSSILSDLPTVLGNEAARSVSDLIFATLTGNAGSYYSAGHGNLIIGVTSALGITSLTAAVAKLRTRTDRDKRIIGFVPTVLLVPAALEAAGRQLLNSTAVQRDQSADNQATGNPLAGLNLTLVVEPRLDASSETAWYLFSLPHHGAVLLATLMGRLGAIVESVDPPANVLGMQWRAYMDYGVSLAEYRATVKNTGAA